MPKAIDITGKKFGALVALRPTTDRDQRGSVVWECECACGVRARVNASDLKHGNTTSCGCRANLKKHGEANSVEYSTWERIKGRCHNPKSRRFKDWGGRGIVVCERWRNSFEAFLEDMGRRPPDKTSIDRIDNDGHYEPGNCRWSTPKEQQNNTRKQKRTA